MHLQCTQYSIDFFPISYLGIDSLHFQFLCNSSTSQPSKLCPDSHCYLLYLILLGIRSE
ncbi:hypothetical protein HanRHA438_Chr11g0520241 [Helianthus annuus]|nr:hypothetical protein HanRHA438_Chr11g0520241 [Helianthus annuus]